MPGRVRDRIRGGDRTVQGDCQRRILAAVVIALTSGGVDAVGQDAPVATVGSRVRLTVDDPDRPELVGSLTEVWLDSVAVGGRSASDRTVLRRSLVRNLEVSSGQVSRVASGIATGGLVGAAGGGMLMMITTLIANCGGPPRRSGDGGQLSLGLCVERPSTGEVVGTIVGAALLGALVEGVRAAENPDDLWAQGRWPDEAAAPARPTRPSLHLGFGTADGHGVVRLGLRWRP